MDDEVMLDFLARQGAQARYVTSVCTGSLLLAAAGLLKGYRAACHWMARDDLALLGAIPIAERVVLDRNRITGAGVTAGIDFAAHSSRPPARRNASQSDSARAGIRSRPSFRDRISRTGRPRSGRGFAETTASLSRRPAARPPCAPRPGSNRAASAGRDDALPAGAANE